MTTPKRSFGSLEKIFHSLLIASFLLHALALLVVMNVEAPPPPNQEEYATWLKKVTPPKIIEEVPPQPMVEPEETPEEAPQVAEEVPKPTPRPSPRRAEKPAAKPEEVARRAAVREQVSGAGLLAAIGSASEEGELANVFQSGEVVSKDLGESLSKRESVRVSGGTRIGKKGTLGANAGGDIGDIDTGVGGKVGDVSGRGVVAPKAFVKSSEAVLKAGGIDERGVRMALKRRERGIQQCYERALKTAPKLRGKVTLEWGIDPSGRVVRIKVVQDTLGDAKVAKCMMDIIKRIRFPKATKGIVPVRKTFVFEAG